MSVELTEAYLRQEYPKLLQVISENKLKIRHLKTVLMTMNEYVELLELRAWGEVMTYAHGDPKTRFVPVGWYLGLKQENKGLRDELLQLQMGAA